MSERDCRRRTRRRRRRRRRRRGEEKMEDKEEAEKNEEEIEEEYLGEMKEGGGKGALKIMKTRQPSETKEEISKYCV